MQKKNDIDLLESIKIGFVLYFLISLLINIFNITLVQFYSPAFSMYYMIASYIPIIIMNFIHKFTDQELFIVTSIVSVIADGVFGAILSVLIAKTIKTKFLLVFLLSAYPIYWIIVALTLKIRF